MVGGSENRKIIGVGVLRYRNLLNSGRHVLASAVEVDSQCTRSEQAMYTLSYVK